MIKVPVSYGELYDKITILQIKLDKFDDPAKLENVRRELDYLTDVAKQVPHHDDTAARVDELRAINTDLWDIEEGKRAHERKQEFGESFIRLARDVYIKNDRRAALKKQINLLTGSAIMEEKSHADA
ncbi:MAG: DUF6165 family protein [Rhodobacteraceae bacterium]|jgi:hypothetical protein|nr:DUF6165 family protein [Paracoccaceae bacterium]